MNTLERALTDDTNVSLDFYLQDTSIAEFRYDIKYLIDKATCSTDIGVLKAKIQGVLNETN